MKQKGSNSKISRFIPKEFRSYFDLGEKKRSYRQLRTILFTTMLSMAMFPVFIVGSLGYYNYIDLLQQSEEEQLEWQLDGSIKSIEHMIASLKSVIQFAARNDRFLELQTGDQLERLFARLRFKYPFLADLGVIDQSGIQQAYYGSYDLQGTDYSAEQWFKEVHGKGVYVSNVYTGYRQVPHFAIAVSNYDPKTKSRWVLRATIDAATLQQFTNTIKTNATEDLFLVDGQRGLQTSSRYFGKTLSLFQHPIVPGIQHSISENGEHIFKAIGAIEGSPWHLVIVNKRYIHQDDWKSFQLKLFLIIAVSMTVSFIVTYALVKMLTTLIRRSDEMHLAMLKEAEHTNKLASIGRLAAGVGHEINNPLAIINQKVGFVEDLISLSKEDFSHKETIQENLKAVDKSINRCKAITHRLLGFARRAEVCTEKLAVNDIILEVLQFLENAMLYNKIKLKLDLHDDLPEITSDSLQLQQIFLNIINNAIDAIEKEGVVTITSHVVAADIRVVIQDDGPGISEEVLPSIFEPFYTTKETGKGTGLGLSITYGLIKKLGGDITVRSHPDHGTAFTITIPLHNEFDEQK